MNLLVGANDCAFKVISENGIENEVKEMFDFIFSEEWIDIVENGTKQQFQEELG